MHFPLSLKKINIIYNIYGSLVQMLMDQALLLLNMAFNKFTGISEMNNNGYRISNLKNCTGTLVLS